MDLRFHRESADRNERWSSDPNRSGGRGAHATAGALYWNGSISKCPQCFRESRTGHRIPWRPIGEIRCQAIIGHGQAKDAAPGFVGTQLRDSPATDHCMSVEQDQDAGSQTHLGRLGCTCQSYHQSPASSIIGKRRCYFVIGEDDEHADRRQAA